MSQNGAVSEEKNILELFTELKDHHKNDPAKLKFIEGFERGLVAETDPVVTDSLVSEMIEGLKNWQPNPLDL